MIRTSSMQYPFITMKTMNCLVVVILWLTTEHYVRCQTTSPAGVSVTGTTIVGSATTDSLSLSGSTSSSIPVGGGIVGTQPTTAVLTGASKTIPSAKTEGSGNNSSSSKQELSTNDIIIIACTVGGGAILLALVIGLIYIRWKISKRRRISVTAAAVAATNQNSGNSVTNPNAERPAAPAAVAGDRPANP